MTRIITVAAIAAGLAAIALMRTIGITTCILIALAWSALNTGGTFPALLALSAAWALRRRTRT